MFELWDQIPAHLRPDAVDTTRGAATVFPAFTLAMTRLHQEQANRASEPPEFSEAVCGRPALVRAGVVRGQARGPAGPRPSAEAYPASHAGTAA
jgi:hypothetical protein